MRTLIVTAFVSLDGVMEAPGGEPNYRNTAAPKETDGGPIIIHGSARLGASLADAGLSQADVKGPACSVTRESEGLPLRRWPALLRTNKAAAPA